MATLRDSSTEIGITASSLANERPKLVHDRGGDERPQQRRNAIWKAVEERFVADGPFFVRHLGRGTIHRHGFNARAIDRTSRHANRGRATRIAIDEQMNADAIDFLSQLAQDEVLVPNARMIQLRLMPREDKRRGRAARQSWPSHWPDHDIETYSNSPLDQRTPCAGPKIAERATLEVVFQLGHMPTIARHDVGERRARRIDQRLAVFLRRTIAPILRSVSHQHGTNIELRKSVRTTRRLVPSIRDYELDEQSPPMQPDSLASGEDGGGATAAIARSNT